MLLGWAEARLSREGEWMDGVDTPETVMTTRAPAVLKKDQKDKKDDDSVVSTQLG